MNGGQILLVKSQEHMNVQEDQINLKNGSQNNRCGNNRIYRNKLLTLIVLVFEPLLNLLDMSMLPWRWDWGG